MADPYISVIVTAYNRRQYLSEALHSLERQTLDRDRFEVIVVKNFEDPKSDEIIRRNGWRWVYSDERAWGKFMVAGLEETRGEVITFLEDDDLYMEDKLSRVYGEFVKIKDLVYFHNAARVLYASGTQGPIIGGTDIMVTARVLSFRLLVRQQSLDFNLSSISVRAGALQGRLGVVKAAEKSADTSIFVAAALSDGLMMATREPLTFYRVHGLSTSATSLAQSAEPLEIWARSYARVLMAYMNDYRRLADEAKGPVRDWLEWRAATIGLTLGALRGLGGSRPGARDYLTALRALMRGVAPPRLAVAGALGWFLPLSLRRPLVEARRRSLRAQLGLQG